MYTLHLLLCLWLPDARRCEPADPAIATFPTETICRHVAVELEATYTFLRTECRPTQPTSAWPTPK